MSTLAIVQARAGSSRLPNKVLADVAGRPMLAHTLERLKRCAEVDAIVLATTHLSNDDPVEQLGDACGVPVVRGDVDDVLARFVAALEHAPDAARVVRITGDCPLIDPALVDLAVQRFTREAPDYLYLGPPGGFPRGVDTEVLRAAQLLETHGVATELPDREHVTRYLRVRPETYTLRFVEAPAGLRRPYRLCVDETDDLSLVREVFARIPTGSTALQDVVDLLDADPALAQRNRAVEQKKL